MFRTRLPLVASFICAIFVTSLLPANSVSIAGTLCTKLNSTKTVAKIKYTCVKSGKKLVWNKGISLSVRPSPSPSSSVTSPSSAISEIRVGDQCSSVDRGVTRTTLSGTYICKHDGSEAFRWFASEPVIPPSPSPSVSPSQESTAKTEYFGNVYKDLREYLSPDYKNLNINWHISSNAEMRPLKTFKESVELGARIWYQDFNSSEVNIILFTEKDGDWIDQKQRELMGSWLSNPSEQLQSNRLKIYGCEIGGFYFPNIILACVRDGNDSRNVFDAAKIFTHEFTHLSGFTSMQLTNKSLGDKSRFRPAWVEEGMATFMGFFGASQLDPNFINNRINLLSNIKSKVDRNSATSVFQMFKQLEADDYATNVQDAYFLGSITFEYLGKNYGVSKIFETNRLFFQGNSWNSSFSKVYGFSVDELYSKIAGVVISNSWNK